MRKLGSERHRRDISASSKRVACADGAEKIAIEILRVVIPEGVGRVLQQGEGMNAALVERERVNEWLQGRAGRARATGAIDLSAYFEAGKIGGTNFRQDFHG